MDVPLFLWFLVAGGIAAALAVDLLVLHRDAHEVSMREAAITSAAWITLGLRSVSACGGSPAPIAPASTTPAT